MAVELIMSRKGRTGFDEMMKIWRFCEERFGKTNYLNTWDGNFADDTDDWVAFKFWDESMATYLKLMCPDLMTRDEFNFREFNQFDD